MTNEEQIKHLISVTMLLADDIDPKVAKHLDAPPDGENGEKPVVTSECLEWLADAIDACQAAAEGRAWFEGHNARDWAERLYSLCDMLRKGDDLGLEIADKIAGELDPHFKEDEEDDE